jgi:hypothetical protein
MRRLPATAAAMSTVLLLAAACSGSDGKDDSDNSGEGPSAGSTPASPREDKAAVVAAIAAYDQALVTVNREHGVTSELSAVATDAWAEQLVTTYDDNLFSNGLEMVGRWSTEVESVAIDGDSAKADVCSDGSKVYVVEGGGDVPRGTSSLGRTRGVIKLVREDDGWQVDGNASESGLC